MGAVLGRLVAVHDDPAGQIAVPSPVGVGPNNAQIHRSTVVAVDIPLSRDGVVVLMRIVGALDSDVGSWMR